ncbi:MAG: KEOPS complex subunit Pcc1 [Candidatus Thermoplasmatota archaeon]
MNAHATFTLTGASERDIQLIVGAISPEIRHAIPKTQIEITPSGKQLILTIRAADVHALRAACNSYLRWIQTAVTVQNLL